MMNPPCWGKNLPSAMLGNGETDAKTCDDIMKSENGTRHNLSLRTKPERWRRPLMKEHIENSATPITVTAIKIRNASGS
jgi:hypothetical protein